MGCEDDKDPAKEMAAALNTHAQHELFQLFNGRDEEKMFCEGKSHFHQIVTIDISH